MMWLTELHYSFLSYASTNQSKKWNVTVCPDSSVYPWIQMDTSAKSEESHSRLSWENGADVLMSRVIILFVSFLKGVSHWIHFKQIDTFERTWYKWCVNLIYSFLWTHFTGSAHYSRAVMVWEKLYAVSGALNKGCCGANVLYIVKWYIVVQDNKLHC